MILYPAIDLKDGACVRLVRGEMDERDRLQRRSRRRRRRNSPTPASRGCIVVDLNGAFAGRPVNARGGASAIRAAVDLPVQLGGGIRDRDAIEDWLDRGIAGSSWAPPRCAIPELVREACRRFPGRDRGRHRCARRLRRGRGLGRDRDRRGRSISRCRFEDAGVAAIIYTDIARDGALGGVNVEATADLAFALTDAGDRLGRRRVARRHRGAEGAGAGPASPASICGRALYDGRIDPAAALALLASPHRKRRPMLKMRVIPCLDVKDGRVVKGVNFVDLVDAGDPVEQARLYDREGADELCFLDITASDEARDTLYDVVRRTAEQCFMPLTVGGGVRVVEDIRKLLLAGADKVSINTAAVARPEFVREAAEKFGSQCIVVAIDAKRSAPASGRSSPMAAAAAPGSTRSTGPAGWPITAPARSC